jgi:hypothetical protein
MKPDALARELMDSILYTFEAHCVHPKTPLNATRWWDRSTPHIVHPIWCAMTFLSETRLTNNVRKVGYQALLWHDILEDTNLGLPDDVSPEVLALVKELTFESFAEEQREIWNRSNLAKLLKLYDKTSNLLDASWMTSEQWRACTEHTAKLVVFARTTYGDLNIVRLADAMCELRKDGNNSSESAE